jgi:hypothetical protein
MVGLIGLGIPREHRTAFGYLPHNKFMKRRSVIQQLCRERTSAKNTPSQFDQARPEAFGGTVLQKAGFTSIATHRLAHDIENNWYVVTQ